MFLKDKEKNTMNRLLAFLRNTRGIAGMEYIFAMVSIVGITIAFVSVTNGVLREGVEVVSDDLANADSLAQNIGVPGLEDVDDVLALLPGGVPHAFIDEAYVFDFISFLSAPEGTSTNQLTWSMISGTLPGGMSFVDGVLTGTHTLSGPAQIVPVTIQVSDGISTVDQVYDLVFREPGIVLLPGITDLVIANEAYTFELDRFIQYPDGVMSGDVSWSVLSGALPPGMIMSSDTGDVTGTYVGFEDYVGVVTVQASSLEYTTSQTYTFTAQGVGMSLASAQLDDWIASTPVSLDFETFLTTSSSVPVESVEWSIEFDNSGQGSGTVEGLIVVGSTISGTPVQVSDEVVMIDVTAVYGDYTAQKTYTVSYTGSGLTLLPDSPPVARANIFYDFEFKDRLEVSDGIDAALAVWSLEAGILPSGLSFSAIDGRVSGTNTGLYDLSPSLTVRAQLPDGRFAQEEYTLTMIGAGAVASPTVLTDMSYGVPYSFDLKTTLTTRNPFDFETLTWQFSGGPLPSGISLNTQTGVISGTQTDVEDSVLNLLVVASDAADVTATAIHTVAVDGLEPFSFATGTTFSCMLDEKGAPYCFGSGVNGQIGNGTTSGTYASPTAVDISASGAGFVQIDVSGSTACGVQDDGDVWCWGDGDFGQLGNGAGADSSVPVKVVDTSMGGVVRISVASQHVCALTDTARVWCWGNEASGRLGHGETLSQENSPVPVSVVNMSADIIGVSVGDDFSCAWDVNNAGWCWGDNTVGTVGDGTQLSRSTPVGIAVGSGLTSVRQISAGNSHACALDLAGVGYCWGTHHSGRLGDTWTSAQLEPRAINATLMGTGLVDISAGSVHSCAINASDEVWCWGIGGNGRLGDGLSTNSDVPVKATDVFSGSLLGIDTSGSSNHTCVWSDDRSAWCWGQGSNGRLGTGASSNEVTPADVLVPALPGSSS